jgi:transcriptional regulator with XRE-family HTH domain
MKTLAQFIQKKRDSLGLSAKGLAMRCQLPLETIEDIESGKDLFLPVTVRQQLAKALRCSPDEIKKLEKDFVMTETISQQIIESLKELILNGAAGLKCPLCGADLVTRIAKMYDLEDNLVLEPKAHCSKCSFLLHS